MERSCAGLLPKIVLTVAWHLVLCRTADCLRLGLSIGSRPPFLLSHSNVEPTEPYYQSPNQLVQTNPHHHEPTFLPHFHPTMSFYATHRPYPSHGSSSVSPCYSHHFQILTNFYGDYFKKGVICWSGGGQFFNDRDEVEQEDLYELRSDLVKSFTEADVLAPFGTRDAGDLCQKVPKVCELFHQKKQRTSRFLSPASKGMWSSMRDNISNIFSFITRRSSSSNSPVPPITNRNSSEAKFPLFSSLSSATFHASEPGGYLSQLAQQQQQRAALRFNDSHAASSCHGDGCTEEAIHSTRFTGYPASDGFAHPIKGVSVCEESEGVAFPLVGVSATSSRPVRLLQNHPFITQPVFFTRCVTPRTQLLSGKCQQKFQPVAFLVDEPDLGNGRYPRHNLRSSSIGLDKKKLSLVEKTPDDENSSNDASTPLSILGIDENNDGQQNFKFNDMSAAVPTHRVNRRFGHVPKDKSENSDPGLPNTDELKTKNGTRVRELDPHFGQNTKKAETSHNYEQSDAPPGPLLAILSSTPEQRNKKLEAILKNIKSNKNENFTSVSDRQRNRRSFPSNSTLAETRSPGVKPSERFSLSFLDSIFSNNEVKPSYATVPEPATDAPFLDLQGYKQEYILVESGCKVIIDLPAVRRHNGESSLNHENEQTDGT